MRELLRLACRAFPRKHRARQSDEAVDTALLVAGGSLRGTAREALSLVVAGLGQRLREESNRPLRDGLAPLAGVLAVVNLAVAVAGAMAANPPFLPFATRGIPYPDRPEWWWIAFMVAAAGIFLGLLSGDRRLALGAALINVGLLSYYALFPPAPRIGLLELVFYAPSFPVGSEWLPPAVVLALATAAAPLRRLPLTHMPIRLVTVAALVVLSRETVAHFLFLRWPLAALLVLAMAFGALVPRLAVLAIGVVLAAVPSSVTLFAGSTIDQASVIWSIAGGLALGTFVPFARLVRRRLA